MESARPTVFEILEDSREIGSSALKAAAIFAEKWSVSQFDAILETNLVSESRLADLISSALNLTRVSGVSTAPLTQSATELISYSRARDLRALPLRVTVGASRTVELIVADPTQYEVFQNLAKELNCKFEFAVASRDEILRALEICWPIERQIPILKGLADENRLEEN